jgi:hypothetical protein
MNERCPRFSIERSGLFGGRGYASQPEDQIFGGRISAVFPFRLERPFFDTVSGFLPPDSYGLHKNKCALDIREGFSCRFVSAGNFYSLVNASSSKDDGKYSDDHGRKSRPERRRFPPLLAGTISAVLMTGGFVGFAKSTRKDPGHLLVAVLIETAGIALVAWGTWEFLSSFERSASLDRLGEDVVVTPVIIPELEFSNIERQVFAADLVIGADHIAL